MNNLFDEEIRKLLGDAGKMRERMEGVQKTLQDICVVGSAGGGAVRVTMNGERRVLRVEIAEDNMNDRDLLQELIASAINDAAQKAKEAADKKIRSSIMGALSDFDLGR